MDNVLRGTIVNPEKVYGKSAYEIAVMHGFDGTEEEWLDSLVEESAERATEELEPKIEETTKTYVEEATKIYVEEALDGAIGDAMEDINKSLTFVTPELFGAVGDGIADDTEAIQKAIDTGLPVICHHKNYAITGVVIKNDTVIDGNGATWLGSGILAASPSNKYIIQTERDEAKRCKIEISNLKVVASARVINIMSLYYVNKLYIDNCVFDGRGWIDGVVNPSTNAAGKTDAAANIAEIYHSENIVIQNSVLTSSGGMGLYFVGNTNALVRSNEFSWHGRGGIYIVSGNKYFTVQDNRILNVGRTYTIEDGAIDIYGPNNEDIDIIGNYIRGYGHKDRTTCGCRVKGSRNVRVVGNKIETDDSTYCYTFISVVDRDGVGSRNVVISENFLIGKVSAITSYGIRISEDDVPAESVTISNNFIDAPTVVNEDICIRHPVRDLKINGNTFDNLNFYGASSPLGKYSDIIIDGNFCKKISGKYVDNITISNNIIKSDSTKEPISFEDSDGVTITGNIVKCPNAEKWYYLANITNLLISTDNRFETTEGGGTSEFSFLVKTHKGESISCEAIDGLPVIIETYGKTKMSESVFEPDVYELVNYEVANANRDLKISIEQNGSIIAELNDSFCKFAIPAHDAMLANFTDSEGNKWYSNYRDWDNGVDVHLVEEKIFDGTETWTEYQGSTSKYYLFKFATTDKYGMGNVDPYRYGLDAVYSNFGLYRTSINPNGTVEFINDAGVGIQIKVDHVEEEDFALFKAHIKTKYENGTPLKFLYALKTPYTTPIPEAELNAYKNIKYSSGDVNISTNSDSAYLSVSTYIKDKYLIAIEKLIDAKIN